ncbi:MAG: hypothetical protein ABI699_00840 [Caldimonas sp.]
MKLATVIQSGALADEFARLRRDLDALSPTPRHLVVTGAAGREGVTTVSTHLALAMAGGRTDARVLLVDGNLRHPTLEQDLGLTAGPGLLDWDTVGPLPVRPMACVPGLQVLTAGRQGPATQGGPSIEERLMAACERVRLEYAASVWDSPPLLRYHDGLDLAAQCDGTLLVIEMDQTRAGGLRYVRSALERRRAVLLGSVLNRSGRYWPRSPRQPSA